MFLHQYVNFGKKYGPLMKDLWNNPQEKDSIIESYRPQFQTVKEGLSDDDTINIDDAGLKAAGALGAGLLITYIIIGVIFFGLLIWNIVALAHYWKQLDTVWKVLALVFMLMGGTPVSLILIYVGKSESRKNRHRNNDDDDDGDDDKDDDKNDNNGGSKRRKSRNSNNNNAE